MSWSPHYNVHYSTDPVMELIRAYETSASDNDTDTDCSVAETQRPKIEGLQSILHLQLKKNLEDVYR